MPGSGDTIILYHGSPERTVSPSSDAVGRRRDFGEGFYLTEDVRLAREWSVCRPDARSGWVHRFELDTEGLRILDFQEKGVLCWLAELMKRRAADDSRRYRLLSARFIQRFGVDARPFDVVVGWRADASYFFIAKEFVRDNIDISILEELLSLGGLGIQYCVKSEKAYSRLREIPEGLEEVDWTTWNASYNQRDVKARERMRALVDSAPTRRDNVFSGLINGAGTGR